MRKQRPIFPNRLFRSYKTFLSNHLWLLELFFENIDWRSSKVSGSMILLHLAGSRLPVFVLEVR